MTRAKYSKLFYLKVNNEMSWREVVLWSLWLGLGSFCAGYLVRVLM